jgi:DNA-binding NarL/FixJ family response regulator
MANKTHDNNARAPKRRVLLVDDHPMIREGLRQLLAKQPDLEVCGEAGSGHEALAAAAEQSPDLVFLDLSLPDMDGVDLIKDFRSRHPHAAVLVFTMRDEQLYAERALRAGAAGYLMKGERPQIILEGVRRVLGGEVAVSEAMASTLLRWFVRPGASADRSPLAALSNRELEVFHLLGEGCGPREIAERLHVSVRTVETHRLHIREKLHLDSAAALRHYAIERTQQKAKES